MKKKNKLHIIILGLFLISFTSSNNNKIRERTYLENELRNSVIEFLGDCDVDIDTCYIPFE
ncbi:MAG: hypothetical protein ACOC3V_00200 [bacterium]